MFEKKEKEKGFFFLEAVILGCLLLAGAGLISLQGVAARLLAESSAESTASFLAQEQLACVRSLNHVELTKSKQLPWLGRGEMPRWQNGHCFSQETNLDRLSDEPGVFKVQVDIYWQEGNRDRHISLERMVGSDEGAA